MTTHTMTGRLETVVILTPLGHEHVFDTKAKPIEIDSPRRRTSDSVSHAYRSGNVDRDVSSSGSANASVGGGKKQGKDNRIETH